MASQAALNCAAAVMVLSECISSTLNPKPLTKGVFIIVVGSSTPTSLKRTEKGEQTHSHQGLLLVAIGRQDCPRILSTVIRD